MGGARGGAALDLPTSTAHRLLTSLRSRGYVVADEIGPLPARAGRDGAGPAGKRWSGRSEPARGTRAGGGRDGRDRRASGSATPPAAVSSSSTGSSRPATARGARDRLDPAVPRRSRLEGAARAPRAARDRARRHRPAPTGRAGHDHRSRHAAARPRGASAGSGTPAAAKRSSRAAGGWHRPSWASTDRPGRSIGIIAPVARHSAEAEESAAVAVARAVQEAG